MSEEGLSWVWVGGGGKEFIAGNLKDTRERIILETRRTRLGSWAVHT